MNVLPEDFLNQHLPLTGVVAAAVRGADRSITVRCDGNAMTRGQVEAIVGKLVHAADALKRRQVEATLACWAFEQARLYHVRRPDGAALVLVVACAGAQPAGGALGALIEAFASA